MRVDNTAESGATAGDETNVSVGNSGGASGTAWTTVTIGTGVVVKYDNAQAAHGGWSIRHSTGTTSAQGLLFWDSTVLGSRSRLWVRCYVRLSSVATARDLVRVRAAGVQVLRVRMGAGGQVELRNSANAVSATSGATTLAANTWYRVEIDARPGATQTNTVRVYVGDSTTLFATVSSTDNYSSATTVDEVTFGNAAAAASLPDSWLDDLAVSDVDWIGPPVTTVVGDTAAEVDAAVAGDGGKTTTTPAGSETDAAATGAGVKTRLGGATATADAAVTGAGIKTATGLGAGDSSTAVTGAGVKTRLGAAASELSAASPGGGGKTAAGGTTPEVDAAAAGSGAKLSPGVTAAEADDTAAGAAEKTYQGDVATEVDIANATTVTAPARPVDTRRARTTTTTAAVRSPSTTGAVRSGTTTSGVRIR